MNIQITEDGLNNVLKDAQDILTEALNTKKIDEKNKKIAEVRGYLRSAYLMYIMYEPAERTPTIPYKGDENQ